MLSAQSGRRSSAMAVVVGVTSGFSEMVKVFQEVAGADWE